MKGKKQAVVCIFITCGIIVVALEITADIMLSKGNVGVATFLCALRILFTVMLWVLAATWYRIKKSDNHKHRGWFRD